MSHDLIVWTRVDAAVAASVLADAGFVAGSDGVWTLAGKAWLIAAHIDPVEDEDIPDDIFAALRGITHKIALSLQPIHAPAAAKTRARQIARTLAEAGQGLWQDLQADQQGIAASARQGTPGRAAASITARVPPQVKPGLLARLLGRKPAGPAADPAPPAAGQEKQPLTLLHMVWCMDHSTLMTVEGVSAFLDILARYLPEAIPRRYGPHEPPAFKYAERGRDHFIATYLADPGTVVYPSRPALSLDLPRCAADLRSVAGRRALSPCTVLFGLDAALLDDPVMSVHLPKAFAALSLHLRPFYGEARCLKGYEVGRGGPLWISRQAQSSPLKGPWWRGIPKAPALARVIGPPYLSLWPDLAGWDHQGNLAIHSPARWTERPSPLTIPNDIAQPDPVITDQFESDGGWPAVYPFGTGSA